MAVQVTTDEIYAMIGQLTVANAKLEQTNVQLKGEVGRQAMVIHRFLDAGEQFGIRGLIERIARGESIDLPPPEPGDGAPIGGSFEQDTAGLERQEIDAATEQRPEFTPPAIMPEGRW